MEEIRQREKNWISNETSSDQFHYLYKHRHRPIFKKPVLTGRARICRQYWNDLSVSRVNINNQHPWSSTPFQLFKYWPLNEKNETVEGGPFRKTSFAGLFRPRVYDLVMAFQKPAALVSYTFTWRQVWTFVRTALPNKSDYIRLDLFLNYTCNELLKIFFFTAEYT